MDFSIIIVTYNREKYLERCLRSILSQKTDYTYEIIVIFNGELSYFTSIKKNFPMVRVHYVSTSTPSLARNIGITMASGAFLFFLDDDCFLPSKYFELLNLNIECDVFGGPDSTPPDANAFQKDLGFALSSPFCMGKTYLRHTKTSNGKFTNTDESSLILCNLWIRRKLFTSEGFEFPGDLFRNEENFLLKEMKRKSKILFYNSSLYIYHSRKDNWLSLSQSVVLSAECRVKNFSKIPSYSELIYFSPILFSASLVYWIFHPLSLIGFLFLLYLVLIFGYMIFFQKKLKLQIILFHFAIINFYTIGLLKGIKIYIDSKLSVKIGKKI
jgi:glycosyltransferase involved in cell wall biosynthesis